MCASTDVVEAVIRKTQGRCVHCGSPLALEGRPSKPNGAPTSWEHVGRRIGSLEHIMMALEGGTNAAENLAWSCLWCNVWHSERVPGATDHGGIQPGIDR